VIGLGLRLVISGGREAITRLVVLAVAVALGVGLLLTAVAATNAVTAWNNSHAWFWTGSSHEPPGPARGVAPLWWDTSGDTYDGQTISRFDVAATGASSPVPPGIPRDPGPGQYYASPALVTLLRSTPADQLADRYPGHLAGSIGEAGLPSPDTLAIVVGRTPAQLAATPGSVTVTAIASALPGHELRNPEGMISTPADTGIPSGGIDLILSVVALAMLAPVLIFIATATRLSAARREQRFAALRLTGATRRQVSLLAATESMLAAVGGVAAGFGIFFLLRIPVSGLAFVGQPFFPRDLSLSLPDILAVAIGVPLTAAGSALLALRRVQISPLGVARRVTPRPPRAWRVLPLLAGLAELGFFVARGRPLTVGEETQALGSGFALIVIGLVIAGPWLTMTAARLMARRTSHPGVLIAARRLGDDPKAAFRAVSGLVLALFIGTVAVVGLTTQDAKDQSHLGSAAAAAVVTDQLADQTASPGSRGHQPTTGPGPAASAPALLARLDAIAGVRGIMVVRAYPKLTVPGGPLGYTPHGPGTPVVPVPAGLISCAQLATMPVLGRCPAGATVAAFPADGFGEQSALLGVDVAGLTWPAASVPAARLDSLAVDSVNVATDESVPAVEQVRTALEDTPAYPAIGGVSTIGDLLAQGDSSDNAYQQLANTVILVSLPIAGCTLAAGIAAGLADRKRAFSLLRLTGARLAMLRRVVALEGAVPLLAVAAVAIGTGFAASAEFASVAQDHPMVAPGVPFYLLVGSAIVVSLGIIAATFPLLVRITGPEVARNE